MTSPQSFSNFILDISTRWPVTTWRFEAMTAAIPVVQPSFFVTKKGLLVDQIAASRYSGRRREIHSWLLPTHDNLTGWWQKRTNGRQFIPSFGIWR